KGLGEARQKRLVESKHIVHHQHLAVTSDACSDPNCRNCGALSDLAGQLGRNSFEYHRKRSRLLNRRCVLQQTLTASAGLAWSAPLHAMTTHAMDSLRGEANMTHYGDIDVDNTSDGVGHRDSAFELDRLGPAFLDKPAGACQRLLDAYLVGQ